MHLSVEKDVNPSFCIPLGMHPYGMQMWCLLVAFLPRDASLTGCKVFSDIPSFFEPHIVHDETSVSFILLSVRYSGKVFDDRRISFFLCTVKRSSPSFLFHVHVGSFGNE